MSGVKGMRHAKPRPLDHHRPLLVGGLMLATRIGTAALVNRHPDVVSRAAEPVACAVNGRWALYDVDAVGVAVKHKRRRVA